MAAAAHHLRITGYLRTDRMKDRAKARACSPCRLISGTIREGQ